MTTQFEALYFYGDMLTDRLTHLAAIVGSAGASGVSCDIDMATLDEVAACLSGIADAAQGPPPANPDAWLGAITVRLRRAADAVWQVIRSGSMEEPFAEQDLEVVALEADQLAEEASELRRALRPTPMKEAA
jgi:hypothetical protein